MEEKRPIQIVSQGTTWAVVGALFMGAAFLFLLSFRGITIPQLLNGTTPPVVQTEPTRTLPRDEGRDRNLDTGQGGSAQQDAATTAPVVGSPPAAIPPPAPLPGAGSSSFGPSQPAISDAEIGKPGEAPTGSGGGFFEGVKAGSGVGSSGGQSVEWPKP